MQTETFHIGIVGFGPKGLYSFERLLAYLNYFKVETLVNIHLFNESSSFGAGWVYHKDQPEYLLMNYPNQFISLQPTSKPSAVCEVLSFSEWLSEKQKESIKELDPKVSSRKTVGAYLSLKSFVIAYLIMFQFINTLLRLKTLNKKEMILSLKPRLMLNFHY